MGILGGERREATAYFISKAPTVDITRLHQLTLFGD